jgi:hypothetical protein
MAMADSDGDGAVEYKEFVQMGEVTSNLQLELSSMGAGMEAAAKASGERIAELEGATAAKIGAVEAAVEGQVQTSIDTLSAELEATREQIKEEMAPRLADNAQSTLEAHARVEAAEGQLAMAGHTLEWLLAAAEDEERVDAEASSASSALDRRRFRQLSSPIDGHFPRVLSLVAIF